MINTDTEEFDAEYAESKQNRARVIKELKEKGLPLYGWRCVGWEDTGSADSTCQLCGITKVRFLHHMENYITGDELFVGCYCAGGMENNLQAAKERERLNINRLNRKYRFDSQEWHCRSEYGNIYYSLFYKRKRLAIIKSKYGYFGYRINNSPWKWRYLSFEQARDALFAAQDEMR